MIPILSFFWTLTQWSLQCVDFFGSSGSSVTHFRHSQIVGTIIPVGCSLKLVLCWVKNVVLECLLECIGFNSWSHIFSRHSMTQVRLIRRWPVSAQFGSGMWLRKALWQDGWTYLGFMLPAFGLVERSKIQPWYMVSSNPRNKSYDSQRKRLQIQRFCFSELV